LLFPPRRCCWAPRGQAAVVRRSGGNGRRVIFGALNLGNGSRLFRPRKHGWAEDFVDSLDRIHHGYRGWHAVRLLEEDPRPTAEGALGWAEDYDIDLRWLPKRCPELNPMDPLWGQGKDRLSATKQYAALGDQVERFRTYLRSLSGEEALRTAGVLSGHFWLANALSKNFCGPA
jgi:hypothetical protein